MKRGNPSAAQHSVGGYACMEVYNYWAQGDQYNLLALFIDDMHDGVKWDLTKPASCQCMRAVPAWNVRAYITLHCKC